MANAQRYREATQLSGISPGIWTGVGAPNGDVAEWLNAPIDSIYFDVTNPSVPVAYLKTGTAGLDSDWAVFDKFTVEDGSIFVIDTVTPKITVNNTATSNSGDFDFIDSSITHGVTSIRSANTYGSLGAIHLSKGGFAINGISAAADTTGMYFRGIIGSDDPTDTVPALLFLGGKLSGTSWGVLGATETVVQFRNYGTTVLTILGNGNIGNVAAPAAKLHIDQASTTGAMPVLTLDQGDVSEEFIRLIGTSAADASQSLVDAANMTTPGTIAGWVKVYVQDDAATGAMTDGVYYIPLYTAPTA